MGIVHGRAQGVGLDRLIWRGEVYDVDLGTPLGHEPAFRGRRPAVVVSSTCSTTALDSWWLSCPSDRRPTGCEVTSRSSRDAASSLICRTHAAISSASSPPSASWHGGASLTSTRSGPSTRRCASSSSLDHGGSGGLTRNAAPIRRGSDPRASRPPEREPGGPPGRR